MTMRRCNNFRQFCKKPICFRLYGNCHGFWPKSLPPQAGAVFLRILCRGFTVRKKRPTEVYLFFETNKSKRPFFDNIPSQMVSQIPYKPKKKHDFFFFPEKIWKRPLFLINFNSNLNGFLGINFFPHFPPRNLGLSPAQQTRKGKKRDFQFESQWFLPAKSRLFFMRFGCRFSDSRQKQH